MTKKELIEKFASKSGCEKSTANAQVDTLIQIIKDEISSGGNVKILGFGYFSVKETAERKGRNPKTGVEVMIPKGRKAVFKPYFEIQ